MLKPMSLIISFRKNFVQQYKLDSDTQILYWALWDKWNYLRRPETFNMDNQKLMIETGLKNYNRLNDKRKKLIEAGLIEYIPSKTRGKSSTYALIKNYVENATPNLKPNPMPNLNTNLKQNLNETQKLNNNANSYDLNEKNTNLKPNPIPNLKQNPNKSNRDIENNIYFFINTHARGIIDWYHANVNIDLSLNAMHIIAECVELYGESDTLDALKESVKSVSLTDIALLKYARGVLKNWKVYGKDVQKPKQIKPQAQVQNRALESLMALIEEEENECN